MASVRVRVFPQKKPLTRLARFCGLATLSRKGRGCRNPWLQNRTL
jgi:hypothetical protein